MARVRLAGAGVAVVVGVACSGGCGSGRYGGGGCGSGSGCVFDGPTAAGVALASRMRWSSRSVWQQQCGRGGIVAAAAVWRRRPGGIGVTVSAWRCGSSGRAAVMWHHQRTCTSSRGGPMWRERCGSSGVAAARQMAAAGRSRPGMINQGVARAFARVRRPGLLTFAAVSEVGVSGRRVGGGHSLNS